GVPGLGVWYMTGRSEMNPNAWDETHVGLFSAVPRSGEGVLEAQQVFARIARDLEIPSFNNALGTPVNWYQFTFLMGAGFGIPRAYTPGGKTRAANILRRIREENAKHGYGDYRAPPILQDDVADQYSFNDHVLRRFHETLKNAIDPNGVVSPGRGGIWPAA